MDDGSQREYIGREVDRQLDRSQQDGSIEPERRMEAEGDEAREGETQRLRKRVRSMGVQLQKSRGSQTQRGKMVEWHGPAGGQSHPFQILAQKGFKWTKSFK